MSMDPKPMSAERRAEIERKLQAGEFEAYSADEIAHEAVTDLLAAEAYWRNSVKECPETDGNDSDGMGNPSCLFCGAEDRMGAISHKPDCPWVRAQE